MNVDIAEDTPRKGDVVLLQAGDLVPADLRLVETRGLEVDEWELTGEIAPVAKRVAGEEEVYVYRGSRVTRGSGKGVVVAIGAETEYEEILKQPWERSERKLPALVRGRYVVLLVCLLPPFMVVLSCHGNHALIYLLGLVTAALSVLLQNGELLRYALTSGEARRLKARNIRVRDIAALHAVGNLDIVCLDKTGVLTTRDIEVKRIYFADAMPDMAWFSSAGELAVLTGIACALCNDVMFLEKLDQANPIDKALISFAAKNGFDIGEIALKYKRICDKPFDSEARYMAAGFEHAGKALYFAKGDPEVISRMCASYVSGSGVEKRVDSDFQQSVRANMDAVSQKGDIAIAVAYRSGAPEVPSRRYTFLCLIQLENPLRPGIPEVVERLKRAGVRTIMLTGDRPETAIGIGQEAGIDRDSKSCLTGRHIAGMAFSDVAWQAAYVSIFARLLPSQKGVLIRLFQQKNHVVAMVGDGANDTIALRAADVGVSFVENSSPLARRVSKILINDLADLLALIQSAKRMRRQAKLLTVFRAIVLVSIMFGWYASMLNRT